MIKVGCCGWAESQRHYERDFGVIEVQETFYQPGRLQKYERWRAAAPGDFEFTVKAWQLITHDPASPTYRRLTTPIPAPRQRRYGAFRPSDEVLEAWEVTDLVARTLRAPVVLFQSPATFSSTAENRSNLRSFFRRIDRGNSMLAWEPPGEWKDRDVRALCRELDLVHCVDPFKVRPAPGRVRYYRLHGLPGHDLGYRYTDRDLLELLGMIDRRTAYVLFNNGSMRDDALRFGRLAKRT
jgi:uncharacterized protein YecE (DUF72 family)